MSGSSRVFVSMMIPILSGCPQDDVDPVDGDTVADLDSDSDSDSDSDASTESSSDSDIDSTQSESESESDTGSDTDSSTGSESESDSESSTASGTDSDSESSTASDSESSTASDSESSTASDSDSGTASDSESGTASDTDSSTDSDTDSSTDSSSDSGPDCDGDCVLHVDDDAPAGGDGTSWASAFQTVQEAFDHSTPNQQIWVAGGSYPGDGASSVAVQPDHALSLFGGFAGTETSLDERVLGVHESTLGPAQDSILVIHHDLLVDGFRIRGGQAELGGAVRVHTPGFFTGQVTLRNSLIEDNVAEQGGAIGIATVAIVVRVVDSELRNNSAASGSVAHAVDARFEFERCDVHDNPGVSVIEAFDGGFDYAFAGAIDSSFTNNAGVSMRGKYIAVTGSLFQDNLDAAIRGQWVSALASTFVNNQSDESGGAIAAGGGFGMFEDGLVLRDCLFVANHSDASGGAVAAGDLEIERTRFVANTATEQGGAIFDQSSFGSPSYVRDSVFVDNVAGTLGGGVAGATHILRSTFTGNFAAGEPNGLDSTNHTQFPSVIASVFWPDSLRTTIDPPDDLPVVTIDSCVASSPDNYVDLQGSSVELLGSPFMPADLDDDGLLEFYLDPLGPCVDLASVPPAPEPNELDWTTATTSIEQCTDSGLLDAGMHYTPLSPVGPC